MAEYIEYHPLKFWLDPASIAEIVAHIQTYLVNNPINSTTEIETIIHDYLIAHPELIGGVDSVNGETGEVVLTADNISAGETVTIKDVLDSLQDQIDDIVASIPSDYQQLINDVSDLKSSIGLNLEPIVMQGPDKYIKTNGAVGSTVNITPQTSAGFMYAIVPCSAGDKFTINATGGGSPRVWCFTDSSYVIISRDGIQNNTVHDLLLTAPQNAAYLIINDKSNSVSYKGANHIAEMDNDIETLFSLTGGAFSEIPANADLNNYYTIGNYYCTDANAASILHKPDSTVQGFNLIVVSAFGTNTTYLKQYFIPRGISVNYATRTIRSNGTVGEWHKFAYADVATFDSDGLMSKSDKDKIDHIWYYTNFEKPLYPSLDGTLENLLSVEKTNCTFHDNFYRPDNATEIGNNGSGTHRYYYYDMAPSVDESNNIMVGISNHKAVATNPNNVPGDTIRIKYKQAINAVPYKASITFDGTGVLVISPINTDNYIYVSATQNSFTVGGVGSFTMESVTISHNLGLSTITAYVYYDKINVYVAGQKFASVNAEIANDYVGILFRASDINNIAYSNFDVFNSAENLYSYQDEGIENAISFSNEIVNNSETADYSYGILIDSATTKNSNKSIRFEQRKADAAIKYRSEITVKNPRNSNFALQTKIFEYDLFLPSDYGNDTAGENLWQMHHTPDGIVADGLIPNIAFKTKNGKFVLDVRSFYFKAQNSDEIIDRHSYELGDYEGGKWYHILVFIREGYLPEHNPCTAIWIDGELVHYGRETNAYNTTDGSYLKMGMYKPSFADAADTGTTVRVAYIDNLYVWM